ncbi:MAG: sulfurtransferase complex subunit TusB [Candidatus Dasytiphilus stammeri]
MLHILFNSPYNCDFSTFLRMLSSDDEILLLQDGVIAALEGSRKLNSLQKSSVNIFVLKDDVMARGLLSKISSSIVLVSYDEFVKLTVHHVNLISW